MITNSTQIQSNTEKPSSSRAGNEIKDPTIKQLLDTYKDVFLGWGSTRK